MKCITCNDSGWVRWHGVRVECSCSAAHEAPKPQQQTRFDADKPQLFYIFSSRQALDHIQDALQGMCWQAGQPDASTLCAHIAKFLDGGSIWQISAAFVDAMIMLQGEDFEARPYTAIAFFAHVPKALGPLASTYVYGARKYGRGNHRLGAPYTNYLNSALRHMVRYAGGENLDEDIVNEDGSVTEGSHLPHLAHVAWNLITMLDQPPSRDDRLEPVQHWREFSTQACSGEPGSLGASSTTQQTRHTE